MSFYCLLAVVLLSPVPFGANRPWSWSLWSLSVGLLVIGWACGLLKRHETLRYRSVRAIRDIVAVFIGVLLWGGCQALLPVLPDMAHPLWALGSDALGAATPRRLIALTPDDAIMSLMRILSYGLVFFLSFCHCREREKARKVFWALMSAGFIYSLYGLSIYLGKYGMVLWFEHLPSLSTVSSTFINRNHFATFAGLTLLCTLSLLHEEIRCSSKYHIGGNLGLQRFVENLVIRSWFPVLAFLIIGTALILTASRGGISSTLVAALALLAALNANSGRQNRHVLLLAGMFVVIGAVVFNSSGDRLLAKLDSHALTDEGRAIVFGQTWSAILTNPWLGFGLGSFEEVFPLYKTHEFPDNIRHPILQDYAHNTYLETFFELGIPAALALLYCFLRLALICVRGIFVRKRDWAYPAAGLSATVLVGVHALVDFSMQIPAIAYSYALLMGAACVQAFSTREN